jgi:hypothetical protein
MSTKSKPRIDDQYILDNFDIDKERLIIPTIDKLGGIYFPDFDGKKIKEVRKEICDKLSQFDDDDYVDVDYFGCSGDYEFLIKRDTVRPETDAEVIGRLKNRVRKERKKQAQLEAAAKLLQKNGYYGSIPEIS